jgi:hypothetical protein
MKIIDELIVGLRFIQKHINSDASVDSDFEGIYCYVGNKLEKIPQPLRDSYVNKLKEWGWNLSKDTSGIFCFYL